MAKDKRADKMGGATKTDPSDVDPPGTTDEPSEVPGPSPKPEEQMAEMRQMIGAQADQIHKLIEAAEQPAAVGTGVPVQATRINDLYGVRDPSIPDLPTVWYAPRAGSCRLVTAIHGPSYRDQRGTLVNLAPVMASGHRVPKNEGWLKYDLNQCEQVRDGKADVQVVVHEFMRSSTFRRGNVIDAGSWDELMAEREEQRADMTKQAARAKEAASERTVKMGKRKENYLAMAGIAQAGPKVGGQVGSPDAKVWVHGDGSESGEEGQM